VNVSASEQTAPGRRDTFAAFRYRNYRILWASMAVSFVGMTMQMVARGWLAYDLTGAHTAVGIVMLAWGIPQLLLSLPGGAIADRVDKRTVVILSQAAIALTSLGTGVFITMGVINIPILFVMGVAQGAVFAFNLPARQAMLPEMVPRPGLMNAIALNNSAMNASAIVSPAIAGLLMATLGVAVVFYVQAALNLVVVVLLLQLPRSTSHLAGRAARRSVRADIGIGLRFIWSSRTLRLLMLMAFVPAVLGMPYNTLLPGFAREDMGLSEQAYGLLLAAPGVGALAGTVGIAALSGRIRVQPVQAVAGLGFGGSLVALAAASLAFGVPGAVLSLTLLGLSSASYMTLNNTLLMQHSPPEFYGRVMSVFMLTFSMFPLAAWPLGMLADVIGARTTFVLLGTAIATFIVLVTISNLRYTLGREAQAAEVEGSTAEAATAEAAVP
jgi:MFS family permease